MPREDIMIFEQIGLDSPGNTRVGGQRDALIDTVGTDAFGDAVSEALDMAAGVTEFMSFVRTGPAEAPRIILAHGQDDAGGKRVDAYLRRYHRMDPANRLFRDREAPGTVMARIRHDDILQGDYRRQCYTGPGFSEKLTLARSFGEEWIALSVYCAESGRGFADEDAERLGALGQDLLPLIRLHFRILGGNRRTARTSARDVETRLRMAFPELSGREVSVCARSLIGVTAEGIALDLGIAQTSVLTYRRRAYQRLNINSVHQLAMMLM